MSIFILQYFHIHVIYCFDLIIKNLRPQKRAKGGDKNDNPLPMVFDLEVLYGHLLLPLLPHPARLRKEKQFNCKVAINAELRDLKQELENLTRPLSASGATVTP